MSRIGPHMHFIFMNVHLLTLSQVYEVRLLDVHLFSTIGKLSELPAHDIDIATVNVLQFDVTLQALMNVQPC